MLLAGHVCYQICVCWCLWASSSSACISTPNMVRHDICRHNYTVERGLLWSTTLLLPTLLSDSQVLISLIIHGLWWTISGQVKARVVLTCTNGVSHNHLPVIMDSDRPWTTLWTRHHQRNLKADWIYSTKRMMMQWYGWNLQRLQHSRNNNSCSCGLPTIGLSAVFVARRCQDVSVVEISCQCQIVDLYVVWDRCKAYGGCVGHELMTDDFCICVDVCMIRMNGNLKVWYQ